MDQTLTLPATTVQFCKLRIEERVFHKSERDVLIDFGMKEKPVFRDNYAIIQATAKVTDYYTLVDALNYMSSLGWEVVLPIPTPRHPGCLNIEFVMKRLFNMSN